MLGGGHPARLDVSGPQEPCLREGSLRQGGAYHGMISAFPSLTHQGVTLPSRAPRGTDEEPLSVSFLFLHSQLGLWQRVPVPQVSLFVKGSPASEPPAPQDLRPPAPLPSGHSAAWLRGANWESQCRRAWGSPSPKALGAPRAQLGPPLWVGCWVRRERPRNSRWAKELFPPERREKNETFCWFQLLVKLLAENTCVGLFLQKK